MKTAISLAVGFVLAISLAAINEQLFREIAFYAYFAGMAVIAIVVIAAVVVFFGGTSAVMAFNSIRTEIYANLNNPRKKVRKTNATPTSTSVWSSAKQIDYDNYEIPTYLRRGYDRGAL
ncbi:MAG: hypothetical protein KAI85_10085 [Halopseudomonas aestusnigri]|nr:hypothetical protein [Halopseudomonas aestusnigri]